MCGKAGCNPYTLAGTIAAEYSFGGFDYAAFLLNYHREWWTEVMHELDAEDLRECLDDSFPRFIQEVWEDNMESDIFTFTR